MAAPYSRWRSPASLSEPSPPEELDTSRGSVASAPGYGWAAARPSPSSARGSASPPPDPGESGKCSQSSPLRFRAGASQPSLRLAQDANLGWGGRDGSGEGSRAKPRSSSPCFSRHAFPPEVTEGSGHGKRQAGSRMPASPRLPTALPESKPPLPLKSAGTYFGRDERRIAPSAGR